MVPETTDTAVVWAVDSDVAASTDEASVSVAASDPTSAATDAGGVWLTRRDRARLSAMERNVLEARVAALERAVERKDEQLQAVVDRYETVLAAQERERRDAVEPDDAVEIPFESERRGRGERVADAVRAAVSRFL